MKRIAICLAAAVAAISPVTHAQDKACALTSPEELQPLLGAKPGLKASALPNGVEVCTGKAAGSTVTIRYYPKKDDAEREKEDARIDKLKAAGATVESRKFGNVMCMELRPGGKAARQAYTTSCTTPSTSRLPQHAIVEVSNPSTSIEMRQLAPVAQSIAGKLY